MKKNSKILIIVLISTFLSVNFFSANTQVNNIKISGQEDNTLKALSFPKVSAEGDITEKWNYTYSALTNFLGVAISGDGNYIVGLNSSIGGSATLYKKDSNSTLWNYKTDQFIHEVAMSFYGENIVICDYSQIFLLNYETESPKTEIWKYPTVRPGMPAPQVFYVDISSDGKYIAFANRTRLGSSGLQLFDNNPSVSKQPLWSYPMAEAMDVAISGDGKYIAYGDSDGYLTMFATNPKNYLWTYDTTNPVYEVAISYDGNYIVTRNFDKEFYLFNRTWYNNAPTWNFTVSEVITEITGTVHLDISSDGGSIVVCDDWNLYYFNNSYQSGNKTAIWSYSLRPVNENFRSVDITADGKYIIAAGDDACYLFNSTDTDPKIPIWTGLTGTYSEHAAISALGDYFVIGEDGAAQRLHFYNHDIPIPTKLLLLLGDDDDDDDDDEPAIPLGNYYFLFAIITVISLIIIMKRKVIFNKL